MLWTEQSITANYMKLLLFHRITPNKVMLQLINFIEASFGQQIGHHRINRDSLNDTLYQSNSSYKIQNVSFPTRKPRRDLIHKVLVFQSLKLSTTQGNADIFSKLTSFPKARYLEKFHLNTPSYIMREHLAHLINTNLLARHATKLLESFHLTPKLVFNGFSKNK